MKAISAHRSGEEEKGDDSIRFKHEFDSKEMDESDWQQSKQDGPRISASCLMLTIDDDRK
jgi:hypothetical protein